MKRHGENKKKIVIGVTGSFGSGKTSVAAILRSYGAGIIDADKISRRFLSRGSSTYQKIIDIFGTVILKKNKTIDRRKLAAVAFKDKNSLNKLNRIIHPQVIRIIRRKIRDFSGGIVVLDAPLLIEAGLKDLVDKLIVVRINRAEQLRRLKVKASLNKNEILKRINAQMRQSKKIRLADFIIDNSGSVKQTKKQVRAIRRMLWKN